MNNKGYEGHEDLFKEKEAKIRKAFSVCCSDQKQFERVKFDFFECLKAGFSVDDAICISIYVAAQGNKDLYEKAINSTDGIEKMDPVILPEGIYIISDSPPIFGKDIPYTPAQRVGIAAICLAVIPLALGVGVLWYIWVRPQKNTPDTMFQKKKTK